MELSAFDIQQARVKQVLYKSRLRSVLYGVREADAAQVDLVAEIMDGPHPHVVESPLGQWLDTMVKPQYGHHPEVLEIERTLQQMLSTGRDLAAQYQRGQIEESRTGLDRVNAQADRLNVLFDQLGQRLAIG